MERCKADELIARYIELHPFRGSKAEARLKDSKVAIWALASYFQNEENGGAEAASAYDLPREAVAAALEYYRRHRALIDDRVAANEVR